MTIRRRRSVRGQDFLTTDVADLENGGSGLTNLRHFTEEESEDYALAWTPDSKSIIAGHHRTPDNYALYKQALDAQTPESLLAPMGGAWRSHAAVTPHGKWMIALLWPPEHSPSGDHFVVPVSISAFSNFRRRTANDLAALETSSWAFVRFRSAVGSNYSPPGETRSVIMATG